MDAGPAEMDPADKQKTDLVREVMSVSVCESVECEGCADVSQREESSGGVD